MTGMEIIVGVTDQTGACVTVAPYKSRDRVGNKAADFLEQMFFFYGIAIRSGTMA